jgi:hypothetical protein
MMHIIPVRKAQGRIISFSTKTLFDIIQQEDYPKALCHALTFRTGISGNYCARGHNCG